MYEVSDSCSPEEYLRAALEADTPESRAEHARAGLGAGADDLAPDTEFLLLRQLYLSELEAHRFKAAATLARRMAHLGPLMDVARHDASRAFLALGDRDSAIAEQRLAARAAPPDRRSFQWWALGALLHFSGDHHSAVSAFTRAERWAHDDRPLIRGHRAWVDLETDQPFEGLAEIVSDLASSPRASKGYGTLVLGMISYHIGDFKRAAQYLRAFLRRNASADRAKELALRDELRCARTVLAEIESD